MQPAKLDDGSPGARVYAYLSERRGQWVSNLELATETKVLAVSTWVSAVRKRLEQEPWRKEVMEPAAVIDGQHHYRLSVVDGQMELAI